MKAVSDRRIEHEGPEDADIFFIQDFPSSVDDTVLRILQDRGGDLFDSVLASFDMSRENVRIGSLLNYTPAANTFYKASGSWQLEESQKYLTDYLKTAKHKVLVPMGQRSLDFLTSYDDIDKRRGSVYKYKNFFVVPIQDPSITAIAGDRKAALIKDLDKIFRVAQHGWESPKHTMYVNPDVYQTEALLLEILAAPRLYIDIESKMHSSYIRCIGFAWEHEGELKAACFFNDGSFPDNNIGTYFRKVLNTLLLSEQPKTFHNGMFDTIMLEANGFETKNFDYDTMIAQHVLQPELAIGLDYCASMYTDYNYYKDDGKSAGARIDKMQLGVYNCKDVLTTALVQQGQQEEFNDTTRAYFEYKMQQRELAMHFSTTGMLVDQVRREEIDARVSEKRSEAYKTFIAIQLHYGVDLFKVSQRTKVQKFLYETLSLPLKTSKKGKATSDEDAIVSLISHVERKIQELKTEKAQEPWRFKLATLKLILTIAGYDKLLSSYVNIDLSFDGRARSWYKFWGTETGRWSAAMWYDGTGLNGQTIPREVL